MAAVASSHPGQRIELWFQDEARFGQQGSNSRIWADTGSRPRAPRQTEYDFLYLFAACCPETGQSNAWLMPAANTQTMNGQLADLGRQLPDEVHVVLVLDGAGWHHSTGLAVPPNLTLVHLPAYAPELNPIERVWRELRQRYLSNRIYPDAEALEDAVASAWMTLTEDPRRLGSLTDYPWIQTARQQQTTKEI
ncbi:IS630 family transposase [Aromatoleum anaerobium]|uniref:IS630 family transposase n=1 Tax=Aromatoleum anaerobium TaxID=182180 RepID=A0ABX1PM28_9RHOO|nr:IS630 family transposase [Aromatoleum anaerobium]MCK0505460.1 IS630 family transposase [Aromatoleum anaerobium]